MTKKKTKPFEVWDSYNPKNLVKGYIVIGGKSYGDVVIEEVNGHSCRQYIMCTPKFTYPGGTHSPFSVNDQILGKIEYSDIRVWDKLDGTNILLWKYKDSFGDTFVSFKTRLVPFLRDEGYSTWITMWNRMLSKYPQISDLYTMGNNWAFEMYGEANKIVVDYSPIALECALLYEVNINGDIHDHPEIDWLPRPTTIPWAHSDFTTGYKTLEQQAEEQFQDKKNIEGFMMYIQNRGEITPCKCKAPSILAEQGGGNTISRDEIYTTAINAFMSGETVEEFLLEVYSQDLIDVFKDLIDRVSAEARKYVLFRAEVIQKYRDLGLDLNKDKGHCMRTIMGHFARNKSGGVYTILRGVFGE